MVSYLSTVQIGHPRSPGARTRSLRNLVMSLAQAFERALDRSVVSVTILLGFALAAGTALVGA